MLLAAVVTASNEVAGTSARSRKVAILAELLRRLDAGGEVAIAAAFLSGVPRQGRVGVGYSTVYGVERAPASEPSLTVHDLDRAITEIQGATGSGSATRRKQLLGDLLDRATEQEADFVRRLLTGELRQGALAGIMTDAVASFDRASVEWKLDGIRIQIHRREGEVHIYTRNLNDITHTLPGIVDAVLRLPVKQAVFDGEALWMAEDGPASFQETVSRIDSDAPPEGIVTFLFDVLHVDGEDLLDTPLQERVSRLEALAPHLKVPGTLTSDPVQGERVLDDSLRAGHEGVVVKDAASLYGAGRRGKAWRKVKPVRTYDLVVLGAEWGHGRRRGWLSNLHLGARDPGTGAFVMVGKCFKGLTDELLEWQTKQLLERETARRGIAVLVRPELVVEVALDGVQSSTRYPGGVALRFARVKRYRPDKNAEEADSIDDLRALLAARP